MAGFFTLASLDFYEKKIQVDKNRPGFFRGEDRYACFVGVIAHFLPSLEQVFEL